MAYSKIHPIALGLSLAVMSGLATLFVGLFANIFVNGKPLVTMVGTMYVTYIPSIENSALGALMVFVAVLISGYIAAWIYNLLSDYI